MILRIFHCAQYFNEPSAAYLDIKSLLMSGFPYDLALIGVRVVERCMVFTEMRKSRLGLSRFGNISLLKKKIIMQRQSLSGGNFGALMILYSERACVDIVFGTG